MGVRIAGVHLKAGSGGQVGAQETCGLRGGRMTGGQANRVDPIGASDCKPGVSNAHLMGLRVE